MVQVENEYAGYGSEVDPEYLPWLRDLTIEMGVNELLFTCDGFWDLPKYQIPDRSDGFFNLGGRSTVGRP